MMENEEAERMEGERRLRRSRVFRDRTSPFDSYSEEAFRSRYRLSKATVMVIVEDVKDVLTCPTNRSHPVGVTLKVLVALRYLATGAFQKVNGDLHGISQKTCSRILRQTLIAVAQLKRKYIQFPTNDEARVIKRGFYAKSGFPGVIGAIDCTHIRIIGQGIRGLRYINRKGWPSINTQIVCDHKMKIRNISARWYGSAHDSRIFNESLIKDKFESHEVEGLLVGDSGYAVHSYLMTPFKSPSSPPERRFNKALSKARVTVECAFGVWKRRFPALTYVLRTNLDTAHATIIAAAVLHNIAIDGNEPPFHDPVSDIQPDASPGGTGNLHGNATRNAIVERHFPRNENQM